MSGSNKMHLIHDEWGRPRNIDICSETEPSPTWPYMLWLKASTAELRVRDVTNTEWIDVPSPILLPQYFLYDEASTDLPGYKKMLAARSPGAKTSESVTVTASASPGTIVAQFATEPGNPRLDFITDGTVRVHVHAARTAGNKDVEIYADIYKRDLYGAETLLFTTESSPALADVEADYNLDVVASFTDVETTDRLVVIIRGIQSGAGNNPVATIYMEGQGVDATGSRLILPATSSTGGGGGAPTDAQYLVLALDADLTAERKLTAGDGLDLADGGAEGDATLTVDATVVRTSGAQSIAGEKALTDPILPAAISRKTFLVGAGCPYDTVGETIVAVNAAGPPAPGDEYTILVLGGTKTETGDITIPGYCTAQGAGENAAIDMGAFCLYMTSAASLLDVVVKGAGGADIVKINNANCTLRNVVVTGTGTDAVDVSGTSVISFYNVHVVPTGALTYGFHFQDSSSGTLLVCIARDETNLTGAFRDESTGTIFTIFCSFRAKAAGSDAYTGAGADWQPFMNEVDPNNVTGSVPEQVLPTYSVWLAGKQVGLIFDADRDTYEGASTDDELVTVVGGSKILTKKAGGLYGEAATDVYPQADGGGLFQRNVNHWRTPTDHFSGAFAGWTWAAYAPFDGAPSTVDVEAYPSLLRLINDNITEDHFCYVPCSATGSAYARLTKGVDSYVGLRIQNADDDNDDYVEFKLVDGTVTGFFRLQADFRVGGGAVTTTYIADGLPAAFYLLRVAKTSSAAYCYYVKDTPVPLSATSGAATWTAARCGLVFGQRGVVSSGDRAGLVDYIQVP
jgi:hypothetical protein